MRPRVLQLHFKTVQKLIRFQQEAEENGAYRVAKRIHAVLLNQEGWTSGEIAHLLHSPRSKVSEGLRNYTALGVEGLLEGYRSGRPPALTESQQAELSDLIESGPTADGFLSGVWTSPMIARVIEQEFHVTYHPGHVRKLLRKLGFSVQRPQRVLSQAAPEKQDRWHRRTYPDIKKKPTCKEPR